MKFLRTAVLAFAFLASSASCFAQQITKFGVVDTSRVYQAYFRNSAPVRSYESKKADFQAEINKRTESLRALQAQKIQYEQSGDTSNAEKTEAKIKKETQYLQEYTAAKNMELESLKKSLQNSDEFYQKLYSTLGKIAESGGYSMILSLQQSNSILWYSPSVDITDDVIKSLGL